MFVNPDMTHQPSSPHVKLIQWITGCEKPIPVACTISVVVVTVCTCTTVNFETLNS